MLWRSAGLTNHLQRQGGQQGWPNTWDVKDFPRANEARTAGQHLIRPWSKLVMISLVTNSQTLTNTPLPVVSIIYRHTSTVTKRMTDTLSLENARRRCQDDDECGTVCEMRIGEGNQSARRKPTPVPLCRTEVPHDPNSARIRAARMGSRRQSHQWHRSVLMSVTDGTPPPQTSAII